jgi:phosphohistidine swiveling domain-containing protein
VQHEVEIAPGVRSHWRVAANAQSGVPAVLGDPARRHRIRNGQRITVNGNGGVVTLDG